MPSIITIPDGRAREYSPLSLNIYDGCDHHCDYCYMKKMDTMSRKETDRPVKTKRDWKIRLLKDAKKLQGTKYQVLLSLSGDPYCLADKHIKATREALPILLEYKMPTAILTKGGSRCLRDIDLFIKFGESIKVGQSLVTIHNQEIEPCASPLQDRIDTFKELKSNGVRTWCSLEPVIFPDQTLELIDLTHEWVDEYRVGQLNAFTNDKYKQIKENINWAKFLKEVVAKLRGYNKQFYIKKDLIAIGSDLLKPDEIDMSLNLAKPFDNDLNNQAEGNNI